MLANTQAYWDAHELNQRLSDAMQHRAGIEQAKGILMAAQGVSEDDAFDILVRASQRENIKLRDIAHRIVVDAVSRACESNSNAERGAAMSDDSTAALAAGMAYAEWATLDLWVASVGVGGNLTRHSVDAIVRGERKASPHEHDLLAACLNDWFVERGQDHPVPFWRDLGAA